MTASDDHDHDLGLPHDLAKILSRRRAVGLLGAAGAAMVLGACDGFGVPFGGAEGRAEEDLIAKAVGGGECVRHPSETAGPFPADGSNRVHGTLANVLDDTGIVRKDMRPNVAGDASSAASGVQLDLTIRVVDVSASCKPLGGYVVYLWHCDADGRYSLYEVENATYLRAVGEADARGEVQFTTIVPGCYAGRVPHMHFEIYPTLAKATNYRNRILTSQLAVPDAISKEVFGNSPDYKMSLRNLDRTPPLERDFIFANNTAAQLNAQTLEMSGDVQSGYKGSVTIGLTLAA